MHKYTSFFSRASFLRVGLVLGTLLLAGCNVSLKNLTPATFSDNPSEVYSITVQIHPQSASVVKDSIKPNIVIDGNIYPMTKSDMGKDIYDFEYHLPPTHPPHGAYYFLVNFKMQGNNGIVDRSVSSKLFPFNVVNRYVLTMDVNRAPVGAKVSVLGRGFTPQDTVTVDNQPAKTDFESSNSLSFFVPTVTPNKNYDVAIQGASGNLAIGTLRVDPGKLLVTPMSIALSKGATQPVVFRIPNPAPPGGFAIDVTTDIPKSVIMPDVVIPAGSRTVSVNVQGGETGSGTLYVSAPGFNEIQVPISVQ